MKIKKYTTIWFMAATQEYQRMLSTKVSALFFFIGKVLRFCMFFVLLLLLKNSTKTLSGYSLDEVMVFFLTFNIVDVSSQMFFRGVYQVSGKIRSGELDGYLAKPVHVLFRLLTGAPDMNDFLLFIPLVGFSIYYISTLHFSLTPMNILFYFVFLLNGFFVSLAFHIFVICFGVITTEVDNTIMLYRDISQMGRFPVAIYQEPLRFFVTYVIPVAIMMNVPAQVLLGKIPYISLFIYSFISILFLFLSLKTWQYAIKSYTSASS